MLLHSGEPSLCRTHTPALPLSEVSEHSGGDVPVHLLPGAGVPPDHDRVPAQRVQGEGRPRAAGGPGGRADPCRHPGAAGFTRTPAPCPSWPSGSVARAAWVTVALPSPTSLHHRCPLPCHHPAPPATLALCWALSRLAHAYLRGGRTLVFSSIFPPGGPGWERKGCSPAPAVWSH